MDAKHNGGLIKCREDSYLVLVMQRKVILIHHPRINHRSAKNFYLECDITEANKWQTEIKFTCVHDINFYLSRVATAQVYNVSLSLSLLKIDGKYVL